MIRFLQKDTRLVKGIFVVFIAIVVISMVAYLVPGIWDNDTTNSDPTVFATVHRPGLMGRFAGDTQQIKTNDVMMLVQRQEAQQQQKLPDFLMPMMEQRAGEYLVQQAILKQAADKMGLDVSDADLIRELKTGEFAPYLFPDGKFIGEDKYMDFIQGAFQTSVADFETKVKEQMELTRLEAMVTGGVTVSDNDVRQAYLKQGTKVKFDYAVISADDLRKQVNPTDAELQDFFKKNQARYANADPETRKIEYVAFAADAVPGANAQPTDAEVQAYYNQHKDQYAEPEQVETRHILVTVPQGADSKADAAAKAKAADVLKQVKAGGNFADLAKKFSEDPGSKDNGGALPMMPTAGLDPAYAKAAMALNPGQTSDLVRSQFGYHIIQTIAKQAAGTKPLADVKDQITAALKQQKNATAIQNFQQQAAAQAQKQGLDKLADAYHLHAVTTDFVPANGQVAGLADSGALLTQAFAAAKGAAAAPVSTGDGFAVFQVLDIKAAHAPTFDEYKTHLIEDFRLQRVPELLNMQLNKLADRAKVLNDLKKAAAEMNVPLKSSDLVGRDGQVPSLGAMTGPASVAFTLNQGAISGPINTGSAGAVLVVTQKQEPTTDDIAKNFDQTREQLLGQQRQQIFGVFAQTLIDQYEKAGSIHYAKKAPPSPFGN